MKKKFQNFLKQLGDSPKKKRNISANSFIYEVFSYSVRNIAKFANIVYNFIIVLLYHKNKWTSI